MNLVKTEGVALHALPFKDYDFILTVFTPAGLQKLYARANRRYNPLTAPLTVAEYIYAVGKGEIASLRDGTLLDQNLHIREDLEKLHSSKELIDAIICSQWPGKPAPHLYLLFRQFLNALNYALISPNRLATVFYLKVMKYEGILQLRGAACYRYGGECYETNDFPRGALFFSAEEEKYLQHLAESRTLKTIALPPEDLPLSEKIKVLFHQAFERVPQTPK